MRVETIDYKQLLDCLFEVYLWQVILGYPNSSPDIFAHVSFKKTKWMDGRIVKDSHVNENWIKSLKMRDLVGKDHKKGMVIIELRPNILQRNDKILSGIMHFGSVQYWINEIHDSISAHNSPSNVVCNLNTGLPTEMSLWIFEMASNPNIKMIYFKSEHFCLRSLILMNSIVLWI